MRRIKDINNIIGKTVAGKEDSDGVFIIRFTDDTYIYGEADTEGSYISWDWTEDNYALNLAGVITDEELDEREKNDKEKEISDLRKKLEVLERGME